MIYFTIFVNENNVQQIYNFRMFKKVLVSCPTSLHKNYCFSEWLGNTMEFNYPNYEIMLFDNSNDKGANTNFLNEEFKNNYGNSNKFKAVYSKKSQEISSVIERMCISSNDMRDYFLKNDFDYLLSLESDIFAPKNIIETLMFHNMQVVGGLYYRDSGKYRKLMVQKHIVSSPRNIKAVNLEAHEDAYFIDGTTKKVASIGLGCVLIHRSVLEKIKFRFEDGINQHPDSFFSEDLFRNKISIWADTSVMCEHENEQWGIFGIDYK